MPTTSTDPRAAAAALLAPGTTCHGFAVERCETVPELDSDAYVLRHTASGARLLYLACDDENKAFAIGFKTPPADSTGVFHILEHSVLCGSAKFPVKEPFVDLIKSSMQTFLNAMTYPDKTIYPVATTNEQDLYNLMDVYLDAVFNPAIYTKPTIFEQEGWHYELEEPEGELTYNGAKWDCMSGAEQLRVSAAIVRRLNPQCGFVLMDKLEQMDAATLAEFGAWLEQEGLQVIATRVSTGGECSIIIEDGYAKPTEQPANTAATAAPTITSAGTDAAPQRATWSKGVF